MHKDIQMFILWLMLKIFPSKQIYWNIYNRTFWTLIEKMRITIKRSMILLLLLLFYKIIFYNRLLLLYSFLVLRHNFLHLNHNHNLVLWFLWLWLLELLFLSIFNQRLELWNILLICWICCWNCVYFVRWIHWIH